ncbi:sensor histidine kinase KdpD [Brachybacterium sp. sponge]|uniref:sensor histidine kinase n=1 Tax=Brachybacterium sp. sponge TaxID=1775432 RepID=UPI0007A40298|nr:HAMP domain-containing sensor histidine kinase [Brachybacterium sp. sponge]
MTVLLVVIVALWLGTAAYLVVVLRQITMVRRRLEERAGQESPSAVTLALVVPQLEQLTARVNEAVEQARQASTRTRAEERRIRSFIADVSHDLRTPLTSVRGYLQLLERTDLDAVQHERLAAAHRQTVELGALVDRLYEYAYLLDVEPRQEVERLDVGLLVGEVLLGMSGEIERAGLEVELDPPTGLAIGSDREMLTRIVQNLGRNAVQHGRGKLAVEVSAWEGAAARPRVGAESAGPDVAPTTSDGPTAGVAGTGVTPMASTGPTAGVELRFRNGVAPDAEIDTARLFDRFFTADASRSARTSGLGLSIVEVLVTGMGGTVAATHDPAAATLEIRVRIPSAEAP